MGNDTIWKECIKALLDNLINSPSAAAREVGEMWKWTFTKLEEQPENFNKLQDTNDEVHINLVKKFIQTCETREQGKEATDDDIVQYDLENSLPFSEMPKTKQTSKEVSDALAAFGVLLGYKGYYAIDTPGRFPYTAALFGYHELIFEDILKSKKIPDEQQTILKEIAKYIPHGESQKEYFIRCESAANIERLFGFTKRLLTATEVYQMGKTFYEASSRIGPMNTLTFSNTSGLWNPLERYGTCEFIRRYGIQDEKNMKYKDGFRSTNFTQGILNPALACRRIYLFNEANTWEAFKLAQKSASNIERFKKDSKDLVEEVCSRIDSVTGTLHLVAIKNWSKFKPLSYVTRVSGDILMFSNRGSDISISHAFWCDLRGKKGRANKNIMTLLIAIEEMLSGGVLNVLKELYPLLKSFYGKCEYSDKTIESITGEEMRRLLNLEITQILPELEERFNLELEYISPLMLREKLSKVLEEENKK